MKDQRICFKDYKVSSKTIFFVQMAPLDITVNSLLSEGEEISPSLENFIVLTWLRSIHKDLPGLVKQRYGTELRSQTLASIKPEISQALDSFLEEITSASEAKVLRTSFKSSVSVKSPKSTVQSSGIKRPVCP